MVVKSLDIKTDLKTLINQIWYVEFNEYDKIERTDLIVPTGCINIVFNYLDDYFLIKSNECIFKLPSILITGQLNKVCKIKYGNKIKQIGLVLTPVGFLSIFNLPSPLYTNTFLDGNDSKWKLNKLFDSLSRINNFDDAINKITKYFLKYLKENRSYDLLNSIILEMEKSADNFKIKNLALQFNLSESAFERFFKKMTGITPKAYSNIIKFKNVFNNINNKLSTEELYYDQSHLIKSCKKYTGKTPTELLKSTEEITLKYMLKKR